MKQVQQGDVGKLGLLYERYKGDAFAYFYRCTGDRGRSEDLVQNLFIRMMKYCSTFGGHGEFSYWMFAMARNLYIDHVRKMDPLRKRQSMEYVPEEIDEDPNPEERMERTENSNQLHDALRKLSEEKKEAIILSRFQGLKYREIAKMCNCTENAIKSRIQRGLLELKEILENTRV